MNTLILEVHRKKEITLYTQTKHSSGPYCILPSKWYHLWIKYLKGGSKPARIYIHSLLDSKGSPKSNLEYKKDYYCIPKKLWQYLKSTYGSDQQIECSHKNIYSISQPLGSYTSSRAVSPFLSKFPSFASLRSPPTVSAPPESFLPRIPGCLRAKR